MDRRSFLAASALTAPLLVPPSQHVHPTANTPARAIWIALCRAPEWQTDSYPRADDFANEQEAKGRKILSVTQEAHELAIVVVAEEFATEREARDRQQAIIDEVMSLKDEFSQYGVIYAVASHAAGEVFDVQAFLTRKALVHNKNLTYRVRKLEEHRGSRAAPAVS